ncbi:hypothetical protein F5Y16DRAFT_395932 [Xylariaceae sp. FL0255]|nr:hypothetical protein F5Y16DRAFT_395932 [Xylariaceae sp. FL0255]
MAGERALGFDVNAPGTAIFTIQLIFLILAWVASAMRAFVKIRLLKNITIDDYMMLIALFGYTATAGFTFQAVIIGRVGRPLDEQDLESSMASLKSLYGNMVLSGPVSGLFRAAIALFLLRIALIKWHRVVLYITIAVAATTATAFSLVAILQCSPPSYFWEKVNPEIHGACNHGKLVNIATLIFGSLGASSDLILGLLPVAILWHVRINPQTKIGLAALLSSGIIAAAALTVRLVFIGQTDGLGPGSIFATTAVSISAIVELSLGIMAACTATLPPLLKRMKMGKQPPPNDSIPWQSSIVAKMPPRRNSRSMLVMPSQWSNESKQDTEKTTAKDIVANRNLSSPNSLTNRTLSTPSQWDVDAEGDWADAGEG